MKCIVRPALTTLLSDAPRHNKDHCDLNIVHTSFGTNKTGSSQTVHRNGRGGASVGVLGGGQEGGFPLHLLVPPSRSSGATLSHQPSQTLHFFIDIPVR